MQQSLAGDFSAARPDVVQQAGKNPPQGLFWLLLMANGNFVAPKTFVLDAATGKGSLGAMLQSAQAKALLAVGLAGTGLKVAPSQTLAILAAYAGYFRYGGPYRTLVDNFAPRSKL